MTLSNPTGGAVLGPKSKHTYTILDPRPKVSFALDSSSGLGSVSPAQIAVTLSAASTNTVTVNYGVTGGTATGGGVDYTLPNGTLTFSPGQVSTNINIAVVNDLLTETNETIVISLSNPTNATLGAITQHTYTIIDNDSGVQWDIVLMIGTNNTGQDKDGRPRNTTREIIEGVTAVVNGWRATLPESKILSFAIFPRGKPDCSQRAQVKKINQSIAKLDDGRCVIVLDIGDKFLAADTSIPYGGDARRIAPERARL